MTILYLFHYISYPSHNFSSQWSRLWSTLRTSEFIYRH